jgi:hypothetical protein
MISNLIKKDIIKLLLVKSISKTIDMRLFRLYSKYFIRCICKLGFINEELINKIVRKNIRKKCLSNKNHININVLLLSGSIQEIVDGIKQCLSNTLHCHVIGIGSKIYIYRSNVYLYDVLFMKRKYITYLSKLFDIIIILDDSPNLYNIVRKHDNIRMFIVPKFEPYRLYTKK